MSYKVVLAGALLIPIVVGFLVGFSGQLFAVAKNHWHSVVALQKPSEPTNLSSEENSWKSLRWLVWWFVFEVLWWAIYYYYGTK
jgi:hypothetical protein